MAKDNECCGICLFWRNKFSWMDDNCKTVYAAECHRLPPSTNGHDTYFPKVKSDNWCGEFKRTSPGDELGRKIEWMNKIVGDGDK